MSSSPPPPHQPPPLNVPPSNIAVRISAIDTTLNLVGAPASTMWQPAIPGFDRVRCGCWSILITHPPSGQRLLYDLGVRKDWENLAPATGVKDYVAAGIITKLEVRQNVSEILSDADPAHGIPLAEISGVIWSHYHFDHIGDISTFPPSTKLIVGPGTKKAFMPGFPADPGAHTLESDFAGREVEEVSFTAAAPLRLGRFAAVDYFGDGSFYLLDAPGHAIGHLNALARTTVDPPTFVLLGGDSAHHCGEIRPSVYLPLPSSITPFPLALSHASACPGHVFSDSSARPPHSPPAPIASRAESMSTRPILHLIDPFAGSYLDPKFALIYDEEAMRDTLEKDIELDAREDVFVLLAHDWSLKGRMPEWPRELNGWASEGWKEEWRWAFLKDFEGVVDRGVQEGDVDEGGNCSL